MKNKLLKFRLIILASLALFLAFPATSFASAPSNKSDYYGQISVSSDQWNKIKPLFNTSKKILFIKYNTYNYQDKGNNKLIIQGVNDLLSKNAVYLKKDLFSNITAETQSSIFTYKNAWSVIRDLYQNYDKDTAAKIDLVITGKSLILTDLQKTGGTYTNNPGIPDASNVCNNKENQDQFSVNENNNFIICNASKKSIPDLDKLNDLYPGIIYDKDRDILILPQEIKDLVIADKSQTAAWEIIKNVYQRIVAQKIPATSQITLNITSIDSALTKVNLMQSTDDTNIVPTQPNQDLKSATTTPIAKDGKKTAADGGITLIFPETFQQNKETTIEVKTNDNIHKVNLYISRQETVDTAEKYTKETVCDAASNANKSNCDICHPVATTCSGGSCKSPFFSVDQIGKHRIVAVGYEDENQNACDKTKIAGINTKGTFSVVGTENLIEKESKTIDGLTVQYPKTFYQSESTGITVTTTNEAIKFVQLFASKESTMASTLQLKKATICPAIAKSKIVTPNNCEICHPTELLACTNGVCAGGALSISETTNHRLVAVGFTDNTACAESKIAAINNTGIFNVIVRPKIVGAGGDGVKVDQTVAINWRFKITNYKELINWIINIAGFLLGVACFIAILIGGFTLLTAGGNEEAVKKGTKTISMAILGVVVGAISYGIITLIISILNNIIK